MTPSRSGPPRRPRPVGAGDPTVVLAELPPGRNDWRRAAAGLARSLRVLVFEAALAPGVGPRGPGGEPGSPPVAELVGLLEELDHWPAHLVGVGRAGGLALEVARQRPELVRGLVLHEPEDPELPGTSDGMPAASEPIVARGESGEPGPLESRSGAGEVLSDRLAPGDLEHPVLVSAGSESPLPRREAAWRLSVRLPNARWALLPGVAGQPHQESPDLYIAVVTEFLTVRWVPPS